MGKKGDGIIKTVWQQTRPLPEETMSFLRGIAEDYAKVKTAVYERYSGIRSFGGLASVYDIQKAMRHCGLREQLNLPSVYFELAVRDAVTDIKGMWGMVKNRIRTCISANENLSADDRMYVRTILKLDHLYAAVLEGRKHPMPEKMAGPEPDVKRLDNLLRRLTRRYLSKPETGQADSFCVTPGGYSYRNGQLFLVSRTRRRRVALPLKDPKTSSRQLRVCIRDGYADIAIPVETHPREHADFQNTVYIHLGYSCMFTLSSGNVYGDGLGSLSSAKTARLTEKNRARRRMQTEKLGCVAAGDLEKAAAIENNNLGRAKYDRQRQRERAKLESYINAEINRMLETEKPARIVITKPVQVGRNKSWQKSVNRMLTGSCQGYVRKRLAEKCGAHSIELVQINSKDTGSICSNCGAQGERRRESFRCSACGYESTTALNGARNIERKYQGETMYGWE